MNSFFVCDWQLRIWCIVPGAAAQWDEVPRYLVQRRSPISEKEGKQRQNMFFMPQNLSAPENRTEDKQTRMLAWEKTYLPAPFRQEYNYLRCFFGVKSRIWAKHHSSPFLAPGQETLKHPAASKADQPRTQVSANFCNFPAGTDIIGTIVGKP